MAGVDGNDPLTIARGARTEGMQTGSVQPGKSSANTVPQVMDMIIPDECWPQLPALEGISPDVRIAYAPWRGAFSSLGYGSFKIETPGSRQQPFVEANEVKSIARGDRDVSGEDHA